MTTKRYTSDGRELHNNEMEFTQNGKTAYKFRKMINGKIYETSSVSLDKMREKTSDLLKEISRLEKKTRKAAAKDNTVRAIADVVSDENTDSGMKVFSSEIFGDVRIVLRDNEPWFVAVDVCRALEIDDTGRAVGRLDSDESTRIEIDHPQSKSKKIEVIAVSESGLYSLVLGSRKPEAKEFKRWITHEVIPSIRKNGGYIQNSKQFVDALIPDGNKELKQMMEILCDQLIESQKEIAKLRPKSEFADNMLDTPFLFRTSDIAKMFGYHDKKGVRLFNKLLEKLGIQYKTDIWHLTDAYADKGYAETVRFYKNGGGMFMMWSVKGYKLICEKLKENYGLVPIIDREDVA